MSNSNSLFCLCENILSEREKRMFSMRFGIHCEPMDLDEIASEFDVTRERIKQIINKAFLKIEKANLEIWNSIFQNAKNGFLLQEGVRTFDSELDDLTMAKICCSIYKKRCAILRNKDLTHVWLVDYEAKKALIKLINFIKELQRDFFIDVDLEKVLSYFDLGDYSDFVRIILEDLVCFNKSSRTLLSLMPLENRFDYLMRKFDGVISVQEIMDNFSINEDKARRLINGCYYSRIGKTLYYDYHNEGLLVQLVKRLDYEEQPLNIDEGLEFLGMKFGISKQETIDAIKSLADSRPNIFTRVGNKIALSEWYTIRKKHITRLIDAIVEIIEGSGTPVSSIEIRELLRQKYGEFVSDNMNSIRAYLGQLYKMGEICRIKTKNEYKYFLPKFSDNKS